MAATDLHVFGPALVNVALDGSTYTALGYSADGVRITLNSYSEDVISDDSGPAVPGDIQWMGQDARIVMDMVRFDKTTMEILKRRLRTSAVSSEGLVPAAAVGTLLVTGGLYFGLQIYPNQRTGLTAELPYKFPVCNVEGAIESPVGTRVRRTSLVFRAIPQGGTLYTRS